MLTTSHAGSEYHLVARWKATEQPERSCQGMLKGILVPAEYLKGFAFWHGLWVLPAQAELPLLTSIKEQATAPALSHKPHNPCICVSIGGICPNQTTGIGSV
jgi:hypothetical protein